MNIEHIDQVIASIKGEIELTKKVGFNMLQYFMQRPDLDQTHRHCGTVACIAGHAQLLQEAMTGRNGERSRHLGMKFLGLDGGEADDLFYGYSGGMQLPLERITSEQAIEVLEHLKTTGEVDWSVVTGYDDLLEDAEDPDDYDEGD